MPSEGAKASRATDKAVPAASDTSFTRLHVSPFDADLLKTVLSASVLPKARNISFHTIETFPEKRYGYVELPEEDAEKLRKKLNGATLKGAKMKISKARPEVREEPEGHPKKERHTRTLDEQRERKESKKRKADVINGVTLEDRKVKRGWTETPEESRKKAKRSRDDKIKDKRSSDKDEKKGKKDKKNKQADRRTKSKYTEDEECLLKTKIPPNAMKNLSAEDRADKKRKKSRSREVTVHEFERTTKFPSFLKATGDGSEKGAAAYVEGRGWVDGEGNLLEAVEEKKERKKTQKPKKTKSKKEKTPTPEPETEESDDSTSSSGSSSDEDEDEDAKSETHQITSFKGKPAATALKSALKTPTQHSEPAADSSDSTSSSGSSDDDSEEDTSDDDASGSKNAPVLATPDTSKGDKGRPVSSSSTRSLSIKIPPPITPSAGQIHPLEALYKRAKAGEDTTETPAQAQPFSFFGSGGDADDIDQDADATAAAAPMTPYTAQDFAWRNVRSAAPTPDTAHPSRAKNFWAGDIEQPDLRNGPSPDGDLAMPDAEDGEDGVEEEKEGVVDGEKKSDFESWFWENRREMNQSWMKRSKAAQKAKRNRENRGRASRAV